MVTFVYEHLCLSMYIHVCLVAGVFRECGGARCVLSMVQYCVCRAQSLGIVQQLVMSSGGDEDLASVLGLMHTSSPDAVQLKKDIIKVHRPDHLIQCSRVFS